LVAASLAASTAASADNGGIVGPIPPNTTALITASQMIQDKAAALGLHVTGYAVSSLEEVPSGHRIRYENCDIYYSPDAGCHEIRGAIRDKYNAMGGPY